MSPKRQRLWFLLLGMVLLATATGLVLSSFKQNIVFFYTLEDLQKPPPLEDKKIRVGGLVEAGSIVHHPDKPLISFSITDGNLSLPVEYIGTVPSLFREGQGVVAEGTLEKAANNTKKFSATQVLAKHDENYMPKEIADQLKNTGHWKPQ